MNFQLLNKKWSFYYNWTVLYPLWFFLFVLVVGIFSVFSSIMNFNINNPGDSFIQLFFGAYFGIAILVVLGLVLFIPYLIWFIVASDSIAKLLGWNRLVFNALNLLGIFSGLFFITPIVLWIKVKDVFEDNGFSTTFSGKLKPE